MNLLLMQILAGLSVISNLLSVYYYAKEERPGLALLSAILLALWLIALLG